MAEIKWTQGQEEAITSVNKNILVSAAAGSGKTAVLVERVIRKITDCKNPVDIEDLLIMTFTKAAASQMKEKIRKAVLKALSEKPDDENLRRQVLKVSSANIMTIDALCMSIVKDNLENSELDPNVRIADAAELKLLKADVMADVIEELYASEDKDFMALAEYCMEKNDAKLETMIDRVYEFAQSSPWPDEWIENALAAYTDTESIENQPWFDGIRAMLSNIFDEIIQLADETLEIANEDSGPAKYIDTITKEKENFERIRNLSFEEAYTEIKLVGFDKLPQIKKNDPDVDPEKKEAAQNLRKKYKKAVDKNLKNGIFAKSPEESMADLEYTKDAAMGLKKAVQAFSRELKKKKALKQIADFSDIAHAAVNTLVKKDENGERVYTGAALRMRKRFKEIIVDEYQDTNRLQEEIIKALGSDSVFMVGDVKQSIYAFRMACPDLFVEKYDAYEKDDEENKENRRIVLGENFRSRNEILDFTNLIFSQIMTKEVGAIAYDENNRLNFAAAAYAKHPLPNGAQTEVCFIDEKGKMAKMSEAFVVLQKIKEIISNGKVWDEEAKDFRNAQYSDIVILTRNKNNPEIEDMLEMAKIPVVKQSGKGYFDRLEVRLALNLLKIIDNPYQDIPFTAVLHSPIVQVSSDELALIKTAYYKPVFSMYATAKKYKGDAALEAKLHSFLEMLADFRKKAKYLSVYDLLEYVFEKSDIYNLIAAMPQGESRKANLELLKNRVFNFSQSTCSALFEFNRYIEQVREQKFDYGAAQTANDKSGAVKLMTIHASKGLEFPYVILAKCGHKFNTEEFNDDFICDKDYGVALMKKERETRKKNKTLIRHAVEHKKKCDLIAEEIRLLYVAMTRAKEKLIVIGTGGKLSDKKAEFRQETGMKYTVMKPYMILEESTYLGFILKALSRHKNSVKSADEFVPNGFAANPIYNINCDFTFDILDENNIAITQSIMEFESEKVRADFEKMKAGECDISGLRENMEYVYPYLEATKTSGKISPSSLENADYMIEERAEAESPAETAAKDNEVIKAEKSADEKNIETEAKEEIKTNITSAERGTAYHKVFELLDYERDAAGQIEELVEKNMLTKEAAAAIDCTKIDRFSKSDIGRRMNEALKAGKLKREAEFMMGVDKEAGDMVLVQGVIDAYFVTKNGIVIVDYKTDRGKTEDEFKKAYAGQINCYAEALKRSLSLPVCEKIIYSVELGCEILL